VDGLGLGQNDPERNPCIQSDLHILSCFENGCGVRSVGKEGFLLPTDATLGVEGLPQSATGQTTILSGINCSKLLGRHLQGYPNGFLRDILRKYSLLKQVKELGFNPTFINVYRPIFFSLKEETKWHLSTTTVATLSADIPFFQIDDIRNRRSIYHDFTNESLIKNGFEVPRFSPEEAAHILVQTSKHYDLILYEYFITDQAGHSQDLERSREEIKKLEALIIAILNECNLQKNLVILTSDHGNIEDLSVKTHTRNKVMTLIWGNGAEKMKDCIQTIQDITPVILHTIKEGF